MCGIVGVQGDFPADLLKKMTDCVAHRGPDGAGAQWIETANEARTGLGHRRLAIIDLSAAGCQPMVLRPPGADAGAAVTLVFNGEIYNYRELRAELAAAGHRFTTQTDSEVLLHLYERDGLDMLRRLNGIFAFAIHDARARGRPAGVEPGCALLVHRGAVVRHWRYYRLPYEGLRDTRPRAAIAAELNVRVEQAVR